MVVSLSDRWRWTEGRSVGTDVLSFAESMGLPLEWIGRILSHPNDRLVPDTPLEDGGVAHQVSPEFFLVSSELLLIEALPFFLSFAACGRPSHFELTFGTVGGNFLWDTPIDAGPLRDASSFCCCANWSKADMEGSLSVRNLSMRFLPLVAPISSVDTIEAADRSIEAHELGCVSPRVVVRGLPLDGDMIGLV